MDARRIWLGYWGGWLLLGLFMASGAALYIPWSFALTAWLTHFLTWGLLGMGIIPLLRRFPLDRRIQHWGIHILASVLGALVDVATSLCASLFLTWAEKTPPVPLFERIQACFVSGFHPGLMTYWLFVGALVALDVFRRYKERELQASQLQARLAEAQLLALKMQLHPHFLFNTLHAISALMHSDVKAADRMLARLSDLLRLTLDQAGEQEIPLRQELAMLESYLEIERLRFQNRLRVKVEVPDNLLDAQVPTFILQPLVENALKHGIAPRAAGGQVAIRAHHSGGVLCLEVEDDGAGLKEDGSTAGHGIGTRNTRSRLEHLYGQRQRFELSKGNPGTLARVMLPLHWSEEVRP
ncbi:MAG TPA: sensor histidine kinase [Holophagaceae bacterium]|nr:sensor histidine kinase [Holophagaceae bacterium]